MKSIVTIKDTKHKGSESGIKTKKARHMGNLSIDETQLPEIKNWKVGEEYEIVVKIRQTAIRESDKWEREEYGLPEKSIIGSFEIVSAKTEAQEEKDETTNKYKK